MPVPDAIRLRLQMQEDRRNGAWVYRPPTGISVRDAGDKGVGVFAERTFREGELVGECPVLIVRQEAQVHLARALDVRNYDFGEYLFAWGRRSAAFPMGWAAFLNHLDDPNLEYAPVHNQHIITFTARRRIGFLEELTIDYGFDPAAD